MLEGEIWQRVDMVCRAEREAVPTVLPGAAGVRVRVEHQKIFSGHQIAPLQLVGG